MAQDITTRVAIMGQNPDGTVNVRMDGNPFAMQQQGGASMASAAPAAAGTYRARIGNQEVSFATEADMLRAQMALQNFGGSGSAVPQFGPGGSGGAGGGGNNWLGLAANAGSAINNLFTRSNLDKKITDYNRALDRNREARSRIEALSTKYPDLVPLMLDALDNERRATETAQGALEDLLAANGIAIGVDVVRVANDFLQGQSGAGQSIFSGGNGALLAAGAGLGAGLLLTRNNNNSNNSR